MVKSFSKLEEARTVVYQSLSLDMAAVVCDQLEGAGLPARLGDVESGFAVMVPSEFVAQSHHLLTARRKTPEILAKL